MLLNGLLLAAIGLGHCCLVVLAINVVHGLGVTWRHFDLLARAGIAAALVATAAVAWVLIAAVPHAWPLPARAYAVATLAVALIGLPATTMARVLRGRFPGVSGRSTEIDLAAEAGGAGALIGEGKHAWLLRWPGNESLRLRLDRWEVQVPGLPAAFEGLAILHVTDLHFAHCYRRRFFEAVADEAMGMRPDLIAFTGDLIDHEETVAWIEPVLSRLRAPLGQFAILGNHDVHHDLPRLRGELARAGFVDVDGRWTVVATGGATLAIGGTSAPWGPALDPSAQPEADTTLVLSHTPDLFPRLAAWGPDLVLSGHNHGGQLRLPVFGPVLMPSVYSRRFDLGFFRSGRSLMYVGHGVGGEHPLRYGCPPGVAQLVLRCPEARASSSTSRASRRHAEASSAAGGEPTAV